MPLVVFRRGAASSLCRIIVSVFANVLQFPVSAHSSCNALGSASWAESYGSKNLITHRRISVVKLDSHRASTHTVGGG